MIHLKSLLKLSLAGILLYLASLFFSQGAFIFLLWATLLFVGYLLVLYLLGEITPADLDYLQEIISKKAKKVEIQEELSGNEPKA